MNPTFKQVTKTRYVELVAELAQEIFVQHYTKLTPKVAAALADKYQSDILTDDEIHSGVINYFLIYLGTEPVGYFALDLGPAGAMCLSRLFLKEKARGQGIGRSIVAYAQKLAEGDGRSRLYMKVWARDLKAEGFAKSAASARPRPPPWRFCPAPRWISPPGKSCGGKAPGRRGRRPPPANGRLPGRGRARPAPNIPASTQYPQSRTANAKFGDIS